MTTNVSLPALSTPTYELTIPSSGAKIKYRPFLVKEEKVLLMALESRDVRQIVEAMRSVIETCTFGKIEVAKLPNFDLEYIFLQLRAKSVNSQIDFEIVAADGETPIPLKLDIEKVEVYKNPNHKLTIDLDGNVGVKMRYPIFEDISNYLDVEQEYQLGMEIICDCIETIFYGDTVINAEDVDSEQMMEWVETLGREHYQKIKEFFDTIPVLRHAIKYTDPTTNEEKEFVLEGLESFFTLG